MVILPDCGCCNVCESVTKSLIACTSIELTLDFGDYEVSGTGELVQQYCGTSAGSSTSCSGIIRGGLMSGTVSLSKVPGGSAVNATWRHVFTEPCNTQFVRVEVEASWTAYNNTGMVTVTALIRQQGWHALSGSGGYECNFTTITCETQKSTYFGYASIQNYLYCVNGKFDPSGQDLFPAVVATKDSEAELAGNEPRGCSLGNAANPFSIVRPTGITATGSSVFSISDMTFIP